MQRNTWSTIGLPLNLKKSGTPCLIHDQKFKKAKYREKKIMRFAGEMYLSICAEDQTCLQLMSIDPLFAKICAKTFSAFSFAVTLLFAVRSS